MKIPSNINDVNPDKPDYKPVPDGTYEAECVAATEGTSKTGKPFLNLQWKIVGPEHANRRVFDKLFFADEGAMRRTKVVCDQLGIPLVPGEDIGDWTFLGLKANISVVSEEFPAGSGKRENRIHAWRGYVRILDEQAGGVEGAADDFPGNISSDTEEEGF